MALTCCNHLIQLRRKQLQRKDLQILSRIFQIIIFLEQRNHWGLENLLRNLERLLRNSNSVQDLERIVLSNLINLSKLQLSMPYTDFDDTIFQTTLKKFSKQLEDLKSNYPGSIMIGHPELSIWVQSKIECRPFRAILQEKLARTAE